jgi:hypothetical protein
MCGDSQGVVGVSDITDGAGNRIIVLATLPGDVKVALDTKEKLEAFFSQYPSAQLDFLKEEQE